MRCGAKCFHVEAELDGELLIESVHARTPAEARKSMRKKHGENTYIVSVSVKKK